MFKNSGASTFGARVDAIFMSGWLSGVLSDDIIAIDEIMAL